MSNENKQGDGRAAFEAFCEHFIDAADDVDRDWLLRMLCEWSKWTSATYTVATQSLTDAQPDERAAFFDVVFDGPPSHESGRFVEVEDEHGRSFNAGEWIDRGNGLWALRIARATQQATKGDVCSACDAGVCSAHREQDQGSINGDGRATESPKEMMERMTREWAALSPLQQYVIAKSRATIPSPVAGSAGQAPEGWALVPIKPTRDMWSAWDNAPSSEDDEVHRNGAWAAMIAAAPLTTQHWRDMPENIAILAVERGDPVECNGTFACPICGKTEPHQHSSAEVAHHRIDTAPSLTTDAGAVLTSDQHNAIEVALAWVPPSCPEVHEVLRALLADHPTEQRES